MANYRLRKKVTYWINCLIFLVPILAAVLIVKIIPFVMGLAYSFTGWNGVSGSMDFTGVQNYLRLFKDAQFWESLLFTLEFSALTLGLSNLIGFSLAYFLSKPLIGRNFMRAGFYTPNVIGGLILGFIWQFIFVKVFPAIGKATGLRLFNLAWLGTPATSLFGMAIVEIWRTSGYLMLLYIAGLAMVPEECVESAIIDGARPFRTVKSIILPLMMPTITRCLFLTILGCMRVYDLNLALTGGGPYRSSESVVMNLYATAFMGGEMGYGSAKAIMLLLIIVLFTRAQILLTSRREVEL
jgi:raffinose/stachyose/melibiose transport system permease protein